MAFRQMKLLDLLVNSWWFLLSVITRYLSTEGPCALYLRSTLSSIYHFRTKFSRLTRFRGYDNQVSPQS